MFDTINKYMRKPSIQIKGTEYSLEFLLCADYEVCTVFAGGNGRICKSLHVVSNE